MSILRRFFALFAVTVLALGSVRAQSILISSNSGSAIAGLFTNQSYSYNFGITTLGGSQSLNLTNIGIYMDRGNSTTQPFNVSIYGGLGGSGPLLTNFTVAPTNVGTQMSLINVLFQRSLALNNGNYSLILSSATASGGSSQYFLRQGLLSLNDASGNPLPLTYWVQDNNTSGTAGTNFQASFVLADYQITTNNINYGNYRIGANLSTAVTLTNNAIYATNASGGVVTERLSALAGTTNAATVSGLSTNLLSVNGTTNFTVGLSSANAGSNSGTVTLTYNSVSNGTASVRPATLGTNPVGLGSQEINVAGVGYRLASDSLSGTNVHLGRFHIGYSTNNGALSATVGITNTATADGYSEGLAVGTNGTSGGATAGGLPGGLIAAGVGTNITVGLGAVTAVGTNRGTVTLGFQSSGAGTSGFAATNIGSRVVNVIAQGYSGQAVWSTNAGGSWGNFGNWDVPGGTPGLDGGLSTNDTATFGGAIGAARTVNLDGQSPVLTIMTFSNVAASYRIGPGSGGSITMGTAQGPGVITNAAGAHTVAADVALARATAAGVAEGAVLNMDGAVSGAADLAKTGAGTLIFAGANNYAGTTTVNAGTLQIGSGGTTGTLGAGAVVNNGMLAFNRSDANTVANLISGTGSVIKTGAGTTTLTAANTYNGFTQVEAGELKVNGSIAASAVTVSSGARLSGSGRTGALSGAGSIDPGNSPGILTASSLDASGGLTFNFEFTALNPIFSDATASMNDLLRLTASTPFTTALGGANAVNIYFNAGPVTEGNVYTGAFFTDTRTDFLSLVMDADFNFYVKEEGGAFSYGGQSYSPLGGELHIVVSTKNQSADFAGGTVNGQITQFEVIPEPSTYALLVLGAAALGAHVLRKRRRN